MKDIKYMTSPLYCNKCGHVWDGRLGRACKECRSSNTTPIKIAKHTKLTEKQLMSFPKKDLVQYLLEELG